MTPLASGTFANEPIAHVPTWYLRHLIADTTRDGLTWASLSAGDKTDVQAELAARVAGGDNIYGSDTGYKVSRGQSIGTANLTGATGLTTIVGFAIAPLGITGTKINQARVCNAAPQATTPGTLAIKRWKHQGATTATLVAATVAGTVVWVAVGT